MRRLVYIIGVTAAWQRYDESSDARSRIVEAHASGDANAVASLAQAQLDSHGEDGQKPSFNHYLGWARFQRGDLGGARDAFLAAVEYDAHDARSWLHLGASLLSAFQIPAATAAFANANDAAIKNGDGDTARDALAKLVKAKAWVADWAGFEYAVEAVAQDASSTEGLGVAHVAARLSHDVLRELARHQPHASSIDGTPSSLQGRKRGRLRVGFVTSDFGAHPVSATLRGALLALDAHCDVRVYSLGSGDSWWRRNVSDTLLDRFVDLGDTYSPVKAASRFLTDELDVIIDLHGHTLHSGLPLLAHPSLTHILRLSFCGWPQTTGAAFIDHVVADKVVAVPEQASREFTEKLIVLPESYLPADHANLVGSVLSRPRATAGDVNHTSGFAFGSLSSFQKLDSSVFDVWANILRRSSKRSVLRLMRYALHDLAEPRLREELAARGIHPSRLEFTPMAPWLDHVWRKTHLDVMLDTLVKSGHSVIQDGLWAQVPSVSLAGNRMEARAGATALRAAKVAAYTEALSLRDYEGLAASLESDAKRLVAVRSLLKKRLRVAPLFDTGRWARSFSDSLHAAYEAFSHGNAHVVVKDAQQPSKFAIDDVHDGDESQAILLRIHGQTHKPGWRNVHTSTGEHVDHVLALDDLKDFQDATVAAIYAEAQTLEEAPPSLGILQEWWRVLQPGGAFFLSAPDMKVLSAFLARDDLAPSERDALTELMFQRTAVDFNQLNATLNAAGFCDVEKVRGFGLFNDTSAVAFRGERLALNVVARACRKEGQAITVQFPGMET